MFGLVDETTRLHLFGRESDDAFDHADDHGEIVDEREDDEDHLEKVEKKIFFSCP